MSLYLKYRPQNFKSVVGQDPVVVTLKNALRRQALTHAYLFAGPRGTGKTSLARIIAKAINCLNLREGVEPCNECSLCEQVNQGRLVDLIEIDAASNRGIDEIRDLREKILFAPTYARAKVYIIDEVHMLTKEAFNALLKTLEEPPAHAYFILATTEVHKIPETILSRCQQFTFRRIHAVDIQRRLETIAQSEKITADAEALTLISRLANGALRDAIGLLEQMNLDGHIRYDQVIHHLGLAGQMLVESFFDALLKRQTGKAIGLLNQVTSQGRNLHQFIGEFLNFLREQMLLHVEQPKSLSPVVELIEIFSAAKAQIHQAFIPQLPVEMAILKACGLASPEPVQEKTPSKIKTKEKEEERREEAPLAALDLERIKQDWPRVMQAIETPFIRVSFSDAEPVKFEKGELHLNFKSRSLMEKIENKVNQVQVQSAFEAIFRQKIKLRFDLKKLNLKPVAKAAEKFQPSLVEMAKEVFGG